MIRNPSPRRRLSRLGLLLVLALLASVLLAIPASAGGGHTATPKHAQEVWRGSALNGANGLYVHPNGNVYTASVFGNEITVQNPRNGRVIDRIGPERCVNGPDDVFITDDGTVYWTDILGGTVGMLNPDGSCKTQPVAPGVNPITMSDDGRLFVALAFLGFGLFEIDPDLEDAPRPVFADVSKVAGVNGFDFGPDGLLYAPNMFTGQVVKMDVLGTPPGTDPIIEQVSDGFRFPTGVKFNSKGEMHVADLAEGQIVKVEGSSKTIVADIEGIIDNLAFNSKDRLYFAADSDAQTLTVNRSGRVRALNRAGWGGPSTMAFTDDGKLWVADGGELRAFTQRRNPVDSIYFRFDPPFAGPAGANTVAANGDLLITTGLLSARVQVFNPETGDIIEDIEGIPAAVNAIAHDGGLAIASLAVGVVDGTGTPIPGTAGVFAYPLGMASDGTTLYVTDWALGTVTAVSGGSATLVASGLSFPEGVAIDGDRLLVVEEGEDRVTAIDLDSGATKTIIKGLDLGFVGAVSDFSTPHGVLNGVTVGPDGSVYVAQDGEDNAVFKFRARKVR